MTPRFCIHLQDYGMLYKQAEDAYHACNDLLDQVLDEGPEQETLDRLAVAVENWLERGRLLRDALVALVGEGKVRIPKKNTHVKRRRSRPICSECGFRIPRLDTPEWKMTDHGDVSFRGNAMAMPEEQGEEQPAGSGPEKVGV